MGWVLAVHLLHRPESWRPSKWSKRKNSGHRKLKQKAARSWGWRLLPNPTQQVVTCVREKEKGQV